MKSDEKENVSHRTLSSNTHSHKHTHTHTHNIKVITTTNKSNKHKTRTHMHTDLTHILTHSLSHITVGSPVVLVLHIPMLGTNQILLRCFV